MTFTRTSTALFLLFAFLGTGALRAQDAGVTNILSPASGCGLGSATPVVVEVTNFGGAALTGTDVQFAIGGVPGPIETIAATIAPGATVTYTFTATADLSAGGTIAFDATTLLAGDIDPSNDQTSVSVTPGATVGLPIEQDFTGLANGATTFPAPLSNVPAAFLDWQVNSGSTPTATTGPSAGAGGAGKYIYMESSSGAPFQGAILETACIDLSFGVSPRLIYAYHMYGAGINALRVTAVRGAVVDTLSEFLGQQQTASADPWRYDTVDLSPYIGQTIQLRWTGTMGVISFTSADIALDEIRIEDPQDNDLGAVEVLAPAFVCGASSAETVTIAVRNYGLLDQTGYNVGYRISGPAGLSTATENVGALLTEAGDIDTFSFATPADISVPGTYTVRVWTALGTDANPANDTLVTSFTIPAAIPPIFDDFNSYAEAVTVFPDWINVTTDDLQWETEAGTTTSTLTGPSGDASPGGLGNYIYMETSSPATWGDVTELRSQCISLSAGSSPEFTYAYHMYGEAIGSLTVDLLAGGTVTNLRTWTGEQQTATTDAWKRDTLDLTPYVGTSFELRIRGSITSTVSGSSFNADIALDDLGISNPLPDDIGATTLLNPTEDGGCDLGASLAVEMEITNFGLSPQTGFDVGYSVNGPTGPFFSVENVGGLVVAPGATATYTFATPVDLSADGFYTVKVFTALPSDAIVLNDTLVTVLENITEISSFPWVEDFEGFGICGTACASDCSGSTANNWVQDLTDDGDWLTDFGGTGSIGTGPAIDALPGTSTGQYLYTEASGCNNEEYRLISPCIDIGGLAIPGVRFSYHMAGDDQGTLALDVSEDDGGSWTELWSRSGPDQLSETAPWEEVSVPLAGWGPVIKLRFRGITGATGFESDMAIDAVTVLDIPPFDDLGVSAVLEPTTQCILSSAEAITVVVRNTGTEPIPSYDLSYELDGPTGTFTHTETIGMALLPGDADTLTYAVPGDFSLDGDYTLLAYTTFPTDTVTANDSTVAIIGNIVTVPFPAFDDFDAYPIGATTFDFLGNDASAVLDFQVNEETTSSLDTGPTDDVSIGGNYIYMETSTGVTGDFARVCTPCLDLAGGGTAPSTRYAYHMFGATTGRLDVDVLAAGDTITVDSLIGQQQVASASPWEFSTVDLSPWDGSQIQLCWTGVRGTSFTGDISLDNIDIRDPAPDDLRTSAAPSPMDACDLTSNEEVSVLVVNVGANPQTDFDVSFQLDGGPVVTETIFTTLATDEDTLYTFSAPADFSAEGTYELRVWTELAGDDIPENDTTLRVVTHIITVGSFPYEEDFEGSADGWTATGTNSSWELGTPAGTSITAAASGANAWMTGLSAPYNDDERSTLLTPCMDFSGLDNPGVKMSINYITQAGLITAQDGFVLQSSVDNGISWKNVGEFGDPGWYNFNNIAANPGDQIPLLSVANGWAGFSGGWQEVLRPLDGLGGEPNVAFRIAFASDGTGTGLDGVAIDDFIVVERPAVFLGPDTAVCSGYVLDAGNPGLSFDWSTGASTQTITVTSSGLYTVTVSDSYGFTATDEVNVTILPSPTVDLGPDASSCGPVTLDAGNPGSDYFWNTGENTQTITADVDGTYSVFVTSPAGCVGRDSITVNIEALPEAAFAYSLSGGYVEFIDGSSSADTYFWDFGDGATSTATDPNHIYGASGNYVVTLVVTNACGSDTLRQSLAIFSTGLPDPALEASIKLGPVPTSGLLHLEIGALASGERAVAGLFNAAGQLVELYDVGRTETLDLGHLAAGSYVLRVDVAGRQASRAIVVE